eukprot:15264664-Alexandrium_andersonii.AAC.1
MSEVWQPIYMGNGEPCEVAASFIHDFHPWMVKGDVVQVDCFTSGSVLRVLRSLPNNAPGMD